MHTVKVVSAGLGLLALCVIAGHSTGGKKGAVRGAIGFIPLWLIGSGLNMYVGVNKAGYTVADELPVAAGVFGGPAFIAVGFIQYFRS